jgi:hypothetical protein
MDMINMIGGLLDQFTGHILPHAPFIGVTIILAVIGQHLSLRVFTRPRAYRNYGTSAAAKWKWRFFYWGRETLPLQPILTGMLIGLIWVDPEQRGWTRPSTVGYFATAGTVSLFIWAFLKGFLKKKGIELTLPGSDSIPPEKLPYDDVPVDPAPLPPGSLRPPPSDADVTDVEAIPTLPPPPKGIVVPK